MKLKNLLLISLFIIICSFSCENLFEHAYVIDVHNHSNDTTGCYYSSGYPDTSLADSKPRLQLIEPDYYTRLESKKKWENIASRDTLIIFILNEDTIEKYSWNKIRSDYKILKRYDLSLDDLKNQDWTVNYP